MNLNTITELKRPASADEVTLWKDGYAWLAGGTWLFSEPQVHTDTLIDLAGLKWPSLRASDEGLELAATCTIHDLYEFKAPPEWKSAAMIGECCRSFLSSFKIWHEATIGGNIVMSLPAGPMISLTTALEGVYTLWPRAGQPRNVAAIDFVTGNHANVLAPGELLRSIFLPASALKKKFAFRRASLTHLGRSGVLLIGTIDEARQAMLITITAATAHPVQVRLSGSPTAIEVRGAIASAVTESLWFDDVHSSPAHRRHLSYYYAEEIRKELCA